MMFGHALYSTLGKALGHSSSAHTLMAIMSDCSILRGLKRGAVARVHMVMTTFVDGKKRPEVICIGGFRWFLPFLWYFPFILANLPLLSLVWSAQAYCTLPAYYYMYVHLYFHVNLSTQM